MSIDYNMVMNYLNQLVPARTEQMLAAEAKADELGFPIIGPATGNFCYLIARLMGARQVFELGSGFGYSTAWFARAVKENGGGKVYHTVWDEELSKQARAFIRSLELEDQVEFVINEAVQALRDSSGPFDLIFSDIDKEGYPDSLPFITEKLRPGGVLLVDNLLWYGRIFSAHDHSSSTQAIRRFALLVARDPGWISTIVPIRDGLMLAYKRA